MLLSPWPRLAALAAFCSLSGCLCAQTPKEDYERAHTILLAHSQYGFEPDGSPEAVKATKQMWAAVADFLAAERNKDPKVSVAALNHSLCLMTVEPVPPEAVQESDEEQCATRRGDANEIVELGPGLLLVAPSTGETGTVFLLGERDGKTAVLWSIVDAAPQRLDPHDLVGAWRFDRAGGTCRAEGSPHEFESCGPLYANVGALPPDDKGRERFYVDAGYSQAMGFTIGKQTSIWRWDGDHAELQWIGLHGFMIDQGFGTSFDEDKGILHVGQKGEFRTMYDCGMCIERPIEQRVLLTKSSVEDLGVRSLVPEMDAIDGLMWKLSRKLPTTNFGSAQAATVLRRHDLGMVSDVTRLTKTGAEVCLEADDGLLIIQMRRTGDGGYFITHVAERKGEATGCPSPAFYPPPDATVESSGH
jgi:hypothetical protein